MAESRPQSRLMVLMFTDLVGSVDLKRRLGDAAAAKLIQRHDDLFQYTVNAFAYAEILKDLGDGFLARFSSASDAVHAALHFQQAVHNEGWNGQEIKVRIGLHLGEVSELDLESTGKAKIAGMAVDIAARVMALALPGQILMTRAAFDNARQYVREQQSSDGVNPAITRKWMAHGRYLFKGADEPLEVFEVGQVGMAPLAVPPNTEKARRAVAADQEETLGWRPAVGLEVPDRKHWVLERKLGEGGFGEVWLGEHTKTRTRRVFKFCFDAERLRSFKRELMLFRLLRDALGDRNDIAKLHEVQVDQAPFYLESEFTEDGSLVEWAQSRGGIANVPLDVRLDIVARTAIAVSAAHSVGVLHKDIKPSNILIYRGPNGEVLPRLTDFGIGELTDPSQLAGRNITMISITESDIVRNDSSRTGTRIYAPPEVLMGKPFTIQGDVYALGVLLYQMVVGDLDRPLAQGWEREIADPLLRQDIARCVEGNESERLGSAKELAERLQTLPSRHRAAQRKRIARVATAASIILAVLLSVAAVWIVRERRLRVRAEHEYEKSISINNFFVKMLTSVDPQAADGRNVKVADKFDQAVKQLDEGEMNDPEIEAAVRWAIGNGYRAVSIYQEAEAELEKSLEARRRLLPAPNLELAQTIEDVGAVKWFLADYTSAEAMARESLSMRRALLGEANLPVASSLNYLAAALNSMGQRDQAELFYRQSLAMRRNLAKGKDRELIARSLNNLGTCLRDQEKWDEAERLFTEAIEIIKDIRGPQHIDVANGLSNKARLYIKKGGKAYDDAEPLLLEALDIKKRIYGDKHASVAITLQALADFNFHRNDLEGAEHFCREALAVVRSVFPEGHPSISASLDSLAGILHAENREPDAEAVLKEALSNRSKTLAQDHWEIADNTSRLGECLSAQRRDAEAEEYLKRGFEAMRKAKGETDPNTINAANRLIRHYERIGNANQAAAVRSAMKGT